MYKTLVLEAMYEAISDSLEWGLDCKDGSFNYHIDGIVAIVDVLLGKLKAEEERINGLDKKILETALKYNDAFESLEADKIGTLDSIKDVQYRSMLASATKEYCDARA